MNELEVLQVATPAAQALLTTMLTDGWSAVKARFAKSLSRNSAEEDSTATYLEYCRTLIVASESSDVAERTRAELIERLRLALMANPAAMQEVTKIVDGIEGQARRAEQRTVKQSATAKGNSVVFQQGFGTQTYEAK
ncbi:hypothetical protein [Streptacidiphilus sp. MAP5-3]|uniref:hypothetical protein n=1 Tax=unclassified Streptacidiphilus TaxID=2643834 RepID=UPI003513075B